MSYLWIFIGGGLGSAARLAVSEMVARRFGEGFPWGTLAVNLTGSLAIGFIATIAAPDDHWLAGSGARHFVMLGLLGGYTTFSSFSLQTLELMRAGDWPRAGGNVLLSVTLCLAGAWLGHLLAGALNHPN
ncbi:MAG: fluoride efflux transporter CrcB [Luteolibacter sp.]